MDFRVGYGYDVHAFEPGERLKVGGVSIPYHKKLKGHSDADVLLHAITDALLGSLALGDIGTHFPDTDPDFKGADSVGLLADAYDLIREQGYLLSNLDATVVAERPKLSPYLQDIIEIVSEALECAPGQISIKATTGEKMGFVGREEGIAAQAVVMVRKI